MSIPSPSRTSDRSLADAQFAELVAGLMQELQVGEQPDLSLLAEDYPQHAQRLRELLPAMRAMATLGGEVPASPGSCGALPDPSHGAPGTLGDFRILRQIGRGGMGVVYEAEQLSLSRRVALKVLPFAAMLDERSLQRFKNEALAAAALDHPNIVDVYGVGADRGVHYYAMRLIQGRSMAEVIGEVRNSECGTGSETARAQLTGADRTAASPLPAWRSRDYYRAIAQLGIQAAEALHHAHQQSILHRDIKPGNLLIDAHGKLWVTDFGVARLENDANLTLTGDVLGTLRYMSPEQLQADRGLLDHRTDIYSLGATLYELLTGRPVYDETHRPELIRQVLEAEPCPLRGVEASIPSELETIVLKSLAKDPVDRYASAQALANDLRCFLEHRPLSARRPTVWDRSRKWLKRHGGLVASAAVLLVVAAMGVSLAAGLLLNERNQTYYERALRQQQEAIAEAGQRTKRLHDYVKHINLAGLEWQETQVAAAKAHLLRCVPEANETDLRGFEWRYLWRLCHSLPAPFAQHQGAAYTARFTHDGKLLATGGQDGVRIWDYATGQQLAWLRDHMGDINWISFSADDRQMASAGDDRTVRVWNTATWRTEKLLANAVGGEFSPREHLMAVVEWRNDSNNPHLETAEMGLTFFDTTDWQPQGICEETFGVVEGGGFSPDGSKFAIVARDSPLQIWEVSSKKLVGSDGSMFPLTDLIFSPTQPFLVAAGRPGLASYSLTPEGKPARYSGLGSLEGGVESISLNSDGRRLLAVGRRGAMGIWDFRTPTQAANGGMFRDESPLRCVRVAPDDATAVTTAENGIVRKWSLADPPEFKRTWTSRPCIDHPLLFSPQGDKLYLTATKTGVCVYDPGSLELLVQFNTVDEPNVSLTLSHDGRLAAVGWGEGQLAIWDTATYTRLREYALSEVAQDSMAAETLGLALSPHDGSLWIRRGPRPPNLVFEILTGKRLPFWPDTLRTADSVTYSPDGRWVAVDGQVWDLRKRQLHFKAPGKFPTFSAHSDCFACVSERCMVHVWNTSGGKELAAFATTSGPLTGLALSPDGQTVAAAGHRGTVRLWNVATGRELLMLTDELANPYDLAFSPDGSVLAAAGENSFSGELRVWRIDPGHEGSPETTPRIRAEVEE